MASAARQLDMFPKPKRRSPRVMMHLYDAGGCDDGTLVCYRCERCGHDSGWVIEDRPPSAIMRGAPCPKCNGASEVAA